MSSSLIKLALAAVALSPCAAAPSGLPGSELFERQVGGVCRSENRLIGDGNVKEWSLHKQVTELHTCPGEPSSGCSIGSTEATTYTVSADMGASIGGWISGGFSVSESHTTGSVSTCPGSPGHTICIWKEIPHYEYEVETCVVTNTGGCIEDCGNERTFTSPRNDVAERTYCVSGSCRNNGDAYWVEGAPHE